MFQKYKKLWLGILAMIILSPLGLLATGTAFGEWGVDQLMDEVGFIPPGLERLADFWKQAPMPDYGVPGLSANFIQSAAGYVLSAVVGVALVVLVIACLYRLVKE
ncbi:MAG TPA: cobalamin biosynthesis protein [Syntrophomonas sp.]|jgi:hypothetical protein|nr:cobalamin biosynthesis protein [Syntrophomonas sp.]